MEFPKLREAFEGVSNWLKRFVEQNIVSDMPAELDDERIYGEKITGVAKELGFHPGDVQTVVNTLKHFNIQTDHMDTRELASRVNQYNQTLPSRSPH
jgi:hypothetical protein